MGNYTAYEWLAFFFVYAFLGWVWESCYVSVKQGKWVNRGFLRGPMLPIYGSGAVMMLVVSMPFSGNYVLTWIAGVIGATVLEYITGWAMEKMFKVKYWDYSNQPFNLNGYICLSSSITWGFFYDTDESDPASSCGTDRGRYVCHRCTWHSTYPCKHYLCGRCDYFSQGSIRCGTCTRDDGEDPQRTGEYTGADGIA